MGKHTKVDLTYKVAYMEDGERKVVESSYHGAPSGKKYKAWNDGERMDMVMSVLRDPKKQYLMGSMKGLKRKR